MKAFVTGSTGLLGNNLVRQLLRELVELIAEETGRKAPNMLPAGA